MRRIHGRAAQQRTVLPVLAAVAGVLLLAGCANQGIWPTEPLPPASPGPPAATPSFHAPDMGTDEERGVLTNLEQQALEEDLARQAQDRQRAVQRRIQRAN